MIQGFQHEFYHDFSVRREWSTRIDSLGIAD